MKTQILRSTTIFGLFFMLAIASVNAQTPSREEVNIPFDFSAGQAALKAGRYTVQKISANVMAIRSANGEATSLINVPLTTSSRDSKAGARLVFNRYGDKYFLAQVWLSVETGRQLFTTAAETRAAREYRLANKNARTERVEVAVRK